LLPTMGKLTVTYTGYQTFTESVLVGAGSNVIQAVLTANGAFGTKSIQILDNLGGGLSGGSISINNIPYAYVTTYPVPLTIQSGDPFLLTISNVQGFYTYSESFTFTTLPNKIYLVPMPTSVPDTGFQLVVVTHQNELSLYDPSTEGDFDTPVQPDSNPPNTTSAQAAGGSGNTTIGSSSVPSYPYPSEWVYPNSDAGKYVTGTQVQIFVGNLFVDELDSIQVMYNSNSIPYFGYASQTWDAVGRGRSIAQGQLCINFISEGYLYTILNEFSIGTSTASIDPNVQTLASLYQQQGQLSAQASTTATGANTNSSTASQLSTVNATITSLATTMTPAQLDAVALVLNNASSAVSYSNAIDYKVPITIQFITISGGRTITRTLNNCILTSNEQVIDQSDGVLKDVYGFIAQSFI
jgi:hypothetical protein